MEILLETFSFSLKTLASLVRLLWAWQTHHLHPHASPPSLHRLLYLHLFPSSSPPDSAGFNPSVLMDSALSTSKPIEVKGPGGKATIIHAQYNTPISMYSQDSIMDAIAGQTQTKGHDAGYEHHLLLPLHVLLPSFYVDLSLILPPDILIFLFCTHVHPSTLPPVFYTQYQKHQKPQHHLGNDSYYQSCWGLIIHICSFLTRGCVTGSSVQFTGWCFEYSTHRYFLMRNYFSFVVFVFFPSLPLPPFSSLYSI